MGSKTDPREEISCMIKEEDHTGLLDESAVLHGHHCPGLALGVKAASEAMKRLDKKSTGMEDVIAFVETNNCLSDGVQFVTGCSFGNNSLVFKDLGKTAVTVAERGKKEGLRFVAKPDLHKRWSEDFPVYKELFEKVVKERDSSEEDKKKFSKLGEEVSHHLVKLPAEELFTIKTVEVEFPDHAPIHESYTCEACGESVMSTRTVKKDGKTFCLLCNGEDFFELDGYGINCKGEKE